MTFGSGTKVDAHFCRYLSSSMALSVSYALKSCLPLRARAVGNPDSSEIPALCTRAQLRFRCIRLSRGQDANETCERCAMTGKLCETKKRRVGRQAGVMNRKTRLHESSSASSSMPARFTPHLAHSDDRDILPNPLQFLSSTTTHLEMRREWVILIWVYAW